VFTRASYTPHTRQERAHRRREREREGLYFEIFEICAGSSQLLRLPTTHFTAQRLFTTYLRAEGSMQAHEREALYFDMPAIIPKPKRDDAAETSAQIRSRGMRMKVWRVSAVFSRV
jgi:hypothetical protein